jgi:hypothetical protein
MIGEITLPNTIIPPWTNAQSKIRKVLQSCSDDAVIRVCDEAGNVIDKE